MSTSARQETRQLDLDIILLFPRIRLSSFGKARRAPSPAVLVALRPRSSRFRPGNLKEISISGESPGCAGSRIAMLLTPNSKPCCQDLQTPRMTFISLSPLAFATAARISRGRPLSQSTFTSIYLV